MEPPNHLIPAECTALDVAVLSKKYSSLDVMSVDSIHDVFLDPIPVKLHEFRNIFYAAGQTFGITKLIEDHEPYNHKISFLPHHRTYNNGQYFNLLETIIRNAEIDLNVPRTCFTTASLVDVEKELGNVNTLYDIKRCVDPYDDHYDHAPDHDHRIECDGESQRVVTKHTNVVCSLCWDDILQILRNQWVEHRRQQEHLSAAGDTQNGMFAMLVVTVIFKSCSVGLMPTAIKFRYLIHIFNCECLK